MSLHKLNLVKTLESHIFNLKMESWPEVIKAAHIKMCRNKISHRRCDIPEDSCDRCYHDMLKMRWLMVAL